MDLSYLRHEGIKGQKWGVRRYQYEDGSLTPAGKKRYSKDDDEDKKKSSKTSSEKDKSEDSEVDKLAKEVIRGNYGNGAERKKKLGDKYAEIQNRVNEMLGVDKVHKVSSDDSGDEKKTSKSTKKSSKKSKSKKSLSKTKVSDVKVDKDVEMKVLNLVARKEKD